MRRTSPDQLAERFPEYEDVPRGRTQRRVLYAVLAQWSRRDAPPVSGMPRARLVDYGEVASAVGMSRWETRNVVRDLASANDWRGPLLDIVETPDNLSVAVVPLDGGA